MPLTPSINTEIERLIKRVLEKNRETEQSSIRADIKKQTAVTLTKIIPKASRDAAKADNNTTLIFIKIKIRERVTVNKNTEIR